MVPFASQLIHNSSRTGSLKAQSKALFWRFWSKIDAKQEVSRIFKDSLWLENLTDLKPNRSNVRSIIKWAPNKLCVHYSRVTSWKFLKCRNFFDKSFLLLHYSDLPVQCVTWSKCYLLHSVYLIFLLTSSCRHWAGKQAAGHSALLEYLN